MEQWLCDGYAMVGLCKNGTCKIYSVHRLVAQAFIPNPNGFPIVNHKDEDKTNNHVENLEWCTYKYNSNYGNCQKKKVEAIDYTSEKRKIIARKNGSIVSKAVIQLSKDGEYINEFVSIKQASVALKINASHIGETCRNQRKSAGGYVWRYKKGE